MNRIRASLVVVFLCAVCAGWAQTAQPALPQTGVPQTSSVAAVSAETDSALPGARLLRFASAAPAGWAPVAGGTVAMRFTLYAAQQGGEPLWSEVQQVELVRDGSYNVLLGAATTGGLPAGVFQGGGARWLGISQGETEDSEQPRLLLVGVPYAMEATNAETLGGLPASAFALASEVRTAAAAQPDSAATPENSPITTSGGTANYVARFSAASTIADSEIFDTGTAVGIGNTSPAAKLDVSGTGLFRGALDLVSQGTATASDGVFSWPLNLTGSIYNSSTSAAADQTFQWQVAPFVNDTALAQGYLALNFFSGASAPKQILAINNVGQILFAAGQIFPGVAGLGIPNTFTAMQTIKGVAGGLNVTASSATSIGMNVTGGAYGIFANATSPTGVGVFGSGFWGVQAVGRAYGLYATSNAENSAAVYGNGAQYGVYGNGGRFGLYGVTNQAAGTAGVFAIGSTGVQGSGTNYGVYGASTTTGATGVYGQAPANGVVGNGTGTGSTGVSGTGLLYGVTAKATASGSTGLVATGEQYGVNASASASGSYGVNGNGDKAGVAGTGQTYGVLGQGTASGGRGVYGIGAQYGVYGDGGQFGLYGFTNQGAGTAGVFAIGSTGVQGSGTNYGVYGASTTSGAIGVYGQAPAYGLYGTASAGGATGVYGTAPKFGLYGVATGGSYTVGTYGQGGYGMQAGGTQYGIWAQVQSGSSAIAGARGIYGSPSKMGTAEYYHLCLNSCGNIFGDTYSWNIVPNAGVWADSNYAPGGPGSNTVPALLATADNNVSAVVVNNSNLAALAVYNDGGGDDLESDVIRASGRSGSCSIGTHGNASCTGTLKSTVRANTSAGAGHQVETYAMQAAENWFEDAGSAQLSNGAARVRLDPVFAQTVNTGIEYHVFLTPEADCNGLYVTAKTASGFEVRELGGGKSSIAFEYRIMAKRVGHEGERLVDVTERAAHAQAERAAAQATASQ